MSMNVGKNPISLFSETCFPTQHETEKRKRNRNRNKKACAVLKNKVIMKLSKWF